MKWEYRVALFRWRSDVWQEVNNMTDELNRLGHEGSGSGWFKLCRIFGPNRYSQTPRRHQSVTPSDVIPPEGPPRQGMCGTGCTIEWLSDNGSCYIAGDTRSFARDIGLEPRIDADRKSTEQRNG